MKENQPSATAQRVAMRCDAHQLLDNPKAFDDSLAFRVISEEGASALQADLRQSEAKPLSLYLRAFMAARSRYAASYKIRIYRGHKGGRDQRKMLQTAKTGFESGACRM